MLFSINSIRVVIVTRQRLNSYHPDITALLSFLTTFPPSFIIWVFVTTNYNNVYPSRGSVMSITVQYSMGTRLIKYFVQKICLVPTRDESFIQFFFVFLPSKEVDLGIYINVVVLVIPGTITRLIEIMNISVYILDQTHDDNFTYYVSYSCSTVAAIPRYCSPWCPLITITSSVPHTVITHVE